MLRSYLRLALRSFRRRRGYTITNGVGLAIGLACCAIVAVFVQNELQWDNHHDGADRVYRILSTYGDSEFTHIRFEGFRDDTDDADEQRSLARGLRALPAAARVLQPSILAVMIGIGLVVGGAAGSYPAFVLARKRTADLFGRALAGGGRGWTLRHRIIVLQFVVLVGLGSLSWTACDQLRYMQTDALPYETAEVVRLPGTSTDTEAYATWREQLMQSPAVAAVGMGPDPRPRIPTSRFALSGTPDRVYEGGQVRPVDMHWFDVAGIEHPVVEAMKEQPAGAEQRALINRTAEQMLADTNPVGQSWIVAPGNGDYETPPVEGVLPDLYFHSMRREIAPTLYRVHRQPPWSTSILVRFADGRRAAGLAHIHDVWAELRPDRPVQIAFVDDLVADLYEQERRFTTLGGVLAGLAILLAGIGLASLVAFLTQLRQKEIGIRKALGASVLSIIATLNREYVQIAALAILVGAPVSWYLALTWLDQYALQGAPSPSAFAASGALAVAVAVAAVSLQTGRAASVQPAEVLRAE